MKKKITIIIPIYNTEKYLKQCINSVLNQSYSNIELIAVNDGSTDNSLAILKEYEQNDKRITVLTKTNGGVSSARNLGLAYVTGDYLLFLDSDDYYINNQAFDLLITTAELKNTDILMFHYKMEKQKAYNYYQIKELSSNIYRGNNLTHLFFELEFHACTAFFKTEFIKKYNKLFTNGKLYEDIAWVAFYRLRASRITALHKEILYYRENINSTTNTMRNAHHIIDAYYQLQKENQEYFVEDNKLQIKCLLYSSIIINIHLPCIIKQCGIIQLITAIIFLQKYFKKFNNIKIDTIDINLLNFDKKVLLKAFKLLKLFNNKTIIYLVFLFLGKKLFLLFKK